MHNLADKEKISRNHTRAVSISFPHRPPPIGGPGSFQERFERAVRDKGWNVLYSNDQARPDIVFVVGGTKRLIWIWLSKLRGAKIVHRLDGVSWQHRKAWPGAGQWIACEIRNFLVRIIRNHLSDAIVYQSQFVARWWSQWYGETKKTEQIIYNAVDLGVFSPRPVDTDAAEEIISVEGQLNAVRTLAFLGEITRRPILVYGQTSEPERKKLIAINSNIQFMGTVSRDEIPKALSGKRVFLNLELNPACPNSVIEALASGIPVVGYDTGSLQELVGDEAGIIVPYGADPWRLEPPVSGAINKAIDDIFQNYDEFSQRARQRAENLFNIDRMIDRYLDVIEQAMTSNRPN